ncbi:MAG: hypothetical protein ISR65_06740 [Bacteriovoracaceae bacterium]|nr:hypothetical protein [Bacteriovoracaceae bacterium]
MKISITLLGVFVASFYLFFSCSNVKHTSHDVSSTDKHHKFRTLASVANITMDNALATPITPRRGTNVEVLLDNNEAFQSKLDLINNARQTIHMVYFIFSTDHSTSKIADALIRAAQRGVRVKIIVDYTTNYSNLDFFRMLEKKGGRRKGQNMIQVRFYNRPTINIIQDAIYITSPCKGVRFGTKACVKAKKRLTRRIMEQAKSSSWGNDAFISNLGTKYSRMFLSGFYSKNDKLLAKAFFEGQQLDVGQLMGSGGQDGKKLTKEEKEGLKEIFKMYYRSKVGNFAERITNKLKLVVASIKYKDTVPGFLNTIRSVFPFEMPGITSSKGSEWSYIDDYTHHKLLVADNRHIQLGGRNLENSYHMDPSKLIHKYTFMDTDVLVDTQDIIENGKRYGGAKYVVASYMELFRYKRMLASISDIEKHAPNELLANIDLYKESENKCLKSMNLKAITPELPPAIINKYQKCVNRNFHPVDKAERIAKLETQMYEKIAKLRQYHARSYDNVKRKMLRKRFKVDLRGGRMLYLENLPYDRTEETEEDSADDMATLIEPYERQRTFGAYDIRVRHGFEGKYIHKVIQNALDNICLQSQREGRRLQVVFHNAYVLPPGGILRSLRRMADGTLGGAAVGRGGYVDCSKVTVKFLTNSLETTDLGIINIFAQNSMQTFFNYVAQVKRKGNPRSAKFEYHEYKPFSKTDPKKNVSLHSKVYVIGDDIFIGSANLDARSYMMDTNNGFYFQNVPRFVSQYLEHLDDNVLGSGWTTERTSFYENLTVKALKKENDKNLKEMIDKYKMQEFDGKFGLDLAKITMDAMDILEKVRVLTDETIRLNAKHDISWKHNAGWFIDEVFRSRGPEDLLNVFLRRL